MTASLAAFQQSFFDALRGPSGPTGEQAFARAPGFAVYRNTVMAGCVDALAANFPTVASLLGEDAFRGAARDHARELPPEEGVLANYGERFADWLQRSLGDDAPPLLVAIARLDRAWTECHLAVDAPTLDATLIGTIAPERFAACRLVPHPAARWLGFDDDLPAYALWCERRAAGRRGDAADASPSGRNESALLTRPHDEVTWRPVDRAAVVFLSACAEGRTVAESFEAVPAVAGEDAAAAFAPLVRAGAFTRIDPAPAP